MFQPGANWTADENMDDAKKATIAAGFTSVDVMSWWCELGGGRVAGIAFTGGLCSKKGFNTNLNEKQTRVATSGYVSFQ